MSHPWFLQLSHFYSCNGEKVIKEFRVRGKVNYDKVLRYAASRCVDLAELQVHTFELGPKNLRYANFDQKPFTLHV